MQTFKNFEALLYSINEGNFTDIALALFRLQAKENRIYKRYITYLGVNPEAIKSIEDIPFLPISFFKDHEIKSQTWSEEVIFSSSSTTGAIPSRHYVKSLSRYLENTERIFNCFYGDLNHYHFLALLPSYLERDGSSLVAMVDYFIRKSNSSYSAFYLKNVDELRKNLDRLKQDARKVILWGVSYALLDMAEEAAQDLSHCIVMETGGMKGRREEITREELHRILNTKFNTQAIHSEYGMTELMSQAYARQNGYFQVPAWMKVLARDINDPFSIVEKGRTGGINIIDLANIYTCAFVETQDLGRVSQDGNFEVLGRLDNSDVRGCNLLVG